MNLHNKHVALKWKAVTLRALIPDGMFLKSFNAFIAHLSSLKLLEHVFKVC